MLVDPRLVETPAGIPNGCICGSSTGPFVDTGVNLGVLLNPEIPGPWVYLCPKCVGAIAVLCGYVSPEQVAGVAERAAGLEQENAELKVSLERALASHARVVTVEDAAVLVRDAVAKAQPVPATVV